MTTTPKVSVIIANFNGHSYAKAAVDSVLNQTLREIEVIVVDNCSTDGCYEIVKGMTFDNRLRVFQTPVNSGGPSVPRNKAIQEARGEWIAIMDNDDLMHPDRLRTLVTRAEAEGADIVADDLRIFDDHNDFTARCVSDDTAFWVEPARYVRSNVFYGNDAPLGLLKPIIRARWLMKTQYHATLHMAEDYDLIIRLLLRGARMKVYPEQMYFYRKHNGSISHRLSKDKLLPPLYYNDAMIYDQRTAAPELLDALHVRRANIQMAIAFDEIVVAIKSKQVAKAVCIALRHPQAARLLRLPISVRLRSFLKLARCTRWEAAIFLAAMSMC